MKVIQRKTVFIYYLFRGIHSRKQTRSFVINLLLIYYYSAKNEHQFLLANGGPRSRVSVRLAKFQTPTITPSGRKVT